MKEREVTIMSSNGVDYSAEKGKLKKPKGGREVNFKRKRSGSYASNAREFLAKFVSNIPLFPLIFKGSSRKR